MTATSTLLHPTDNGERYELASPTAMPNAGGFLWNKRMMIQVTCRGYATAQFMQPEPSKYAHAPNLEAKTFMQPEQNYYAHHPGRFVYIKDEETGQIFSAPYEPVRTRLDHFAFSVGKSDITWTVEHIGIRVEMMLSLPTEEVAELWTVKVTNLSGHRPRKISVYPYFPIGYMSWMNQEAEWRRDLGGIVGTSITPYQKATDYFKNKHLKDKTYFLCEKPPHAWEAMQQAFEGEGGLHNPSAIARTSLGCGDARYETPTAVVQYRERLLPHEQADYRFIFGPALDDAEIRSMRARFLSPKAFALAARDYAAYIASGDGSLRIETPDKELDNFVNNWLARQVFYHGDVNRLTTDPQTRNYLQDNMGMSFIRPQVTRQAILMALAQQEPTGAMPDGIVLVDGAELKYINQIPHTDHCVWLPIALDVYLAETGDYSILREPVRSLRRQDGSSGISTGIAANGTANGTAHVVTIQTTTTGGPGTGQPRRRNSSINRIPNSTNGINGHRRQGSISEMDNSGPVLSVADRINRAMDWLLSDNARDERGLSYIAQGDWCDPMNMVGWKGKGVSGWLTLATAYALNVWAGICERDGRADLAAHYRQGAENVNAAANKHLWDGEWYARGITDDNIVFGTNKDVDGGRIWINPQAWAMLGGAASPQQRRSLIAQVDEQLVTPYGLVMFAPPFRRMREDVGRVTQKYPGQGENGSVYNHAAAFYVFALYKLGFSGEDAHQATRAYRALRKMIPGPELEDYLARGQLPVYVPNYYRGAWREFPRTAGRSSQLFNTGTVTWLYRCLVEGLCGLRGDRDGLRIHPQLPSDWDHIKVCRRFRGATFLVDVRRSADVDSVVVKHQGSVVPGAFFTNIREGETYRLDVQVPVVEDSVVD